MGRKSKAKVRRQEILSHFYDVIIDEGFEGASIAKIAKRMDVNPSLIIHYFSTKDAMVLGLIEYLFSTYTAHIIPDLSDVEDPEERLEDLLDVIFGIQWDGIVNNRVFFTYYTLAFRNPEIKQQLSHTFAELTQIVKQELDFAKDKGVIQSPDTHRAADYIIMMMEGANFYQYASSYSASHAERRNMLKDSVLHLLKEGKV